MRQKIGNLFMILGMVLVLAALTLFGYNEYKSISAEKRTTELLPKLVAQIEVRRTDSGATEDTEKDSDNTSGAAIPYSTDMDTIEVDSYEYIGYLSIPSLRIQVPIMSDWSYPQLEIAPCRYAGSVNGNDLVLMAHNYSWCFDRLSDLVIGDVVYFQDVDGITTSYQVVIKDILVPTAVEEMVAGDYDLTLFTCTYGGNGRIAIRCEKERNQ